MDEEDPGMSPLDLQKPDLQKPDQQKPDPQKKGR
jgi:hypothetical protein